MNHPYLEDVPKNIKNMKWEREREKERKNG
jgi:hypothetical protein